MVPTGSIFGRSSRTRRGARARLLALGAVVGTVLLAAAPARADWRTDLSLVERPNDVLDMWGEGRFAVGYTAASDSGTYLFLGGVLYRTLTVNSSSESAGAYYDVTDDCLVSVLRNGQGSRKLEGPGESICSRFTLDNSSIIDPAYDVRRVKHAVGGGAAALVTSPDPIVFLSNTLNAYDYAPLTLYFPPPVGLNGTFGVVRVDGKVYAVAGESAGDSPIDWFWDNDSGVTLGWERQAQTTTPMGAVQAIDAFAAGSPAMPYAVVGTAQGFLQGSLRSSPHPLQKVQDVGGLGVKSLSMNVGFGGSAGNGFGMALLPRPDGTFRVMSPVPRRSDTEAGTVWLDRTGSLPPEVASAPLQQVACWGATSCVFTADRAGAGNLFVYTNAASPQISVVAPAGSGVDTSGGSVVIDEGKTFTLSLSASDLDGDPVLVTATPWSASSAQWSVAVPPDAVTPGDPIQVTGTTGKLCQPLLSVGSFVVNAADGLLAHEAHASFPVYVKHSVPPAKPSVAFSDGSVLADGTTVELRAGGAPLTLRTSVADSGCVLLENGWKPISLGAGAPSLDQHPDAGSNVAVFTPPPFLCQVGGADSYYRYQVTDEGGLSSTQSLVVHVAPWGPPNAVLSPETGVESLNAGDSLTLTPASSRHACEGSASFPGVATEWSVTLADGGVPGPGITYTTTPATSGLVLETQHCLETSSELRITGVNRLGAPDGSSGPVSERQVMVQTDRDPFDPGAFTVDTRVLPSDELLVSVDSPLNCKAQRNLRADLQFQSLSGGGAPLATTLVLPGEWRLPLGVGCQGGHFQLKASMVEDSGLRTAATTRDVEVPRLEAKLESLPTESVLVARCGEGASAMLTQKFPADACPSSAVSWSQVDGPPLEQKALSGDTVSLATQDTGLNELVGRSVVVRVTANAGPGNEASIEHTLPITVEPFVKVRRRTEVPAASETGLVGVSVELLNTTACGVTGVSYVEHLEGLTYVEGSAKVDGQPVAATWKEGELTVSDLSLAGEGTGTLTYVARPHLVGERRMEGEARLRDVTISLSDAPGPQVPDSGCGCTSSGPGPVVFALGVLGAAVRRRRRQ